VLHPELLPPAEIVPGWQAEHADIQHGHSLGSLATAQTRWGPIRHLARCAECGAECAAYGQADRFDVLKIFLVEDKGAVSFAEIGAKLNMIEAAVKGAVRRLRARYRELFREEVANTVDKPDQAATPGSAVAAVYDQYVFSVLSKDSLSPQWGERRVRGERGSCVWKRENAHLTPALSPLKGGEGAFQVLLTEYSSTHAKYVL
jgi:hypothetical protein